MSVKTVVAKNRLARRLLEKPYRFTKHLTAALRFKANTAITAGCSIQRLSPFGQDFFFGYYDKTPWDHEQNLILGLNPPFSGKMPQTNTPADIVLLKKDSPEEPTHIATTTAWCWQQGNMLQWIPYQSNEAILFNHHTNGNYSTAIYSKEGQQLDEWPLPTFAISKMGLHAVGLDFGRLDYCDPGYGYVTEKFTQRNTPNPDDSGLFTWNLISRKKRLLLSLKQITEYRPHPEFKNSYHYFINANFNPSGTRLGFFHRWQRQNAPEQTRFFTINIQEGAESLHLLADHGMTSHYTWQDDHTLIAWATHHAGTKYYRFSDLSKKEPEPIGANILLQDGHPSVSPCGRWMVTDTYPDKARQRHLLIYNLKDNQLHHVGQFLVPWKHWGAWRCDLHPRWSPCGGYICIDSVHEGFRGIYSIDVSSIISNRREYSN